MQTMPPLFRRRNSGESEAGRKAWQCSTSTIASVATTTLHTQSAPVEQGMNLPIQVVGNAGTMAWPALMQDLKDKAQARALEIYKVLADDTVSLRAELKVSEAVLTERTRVERQHETICDLKDEITALKQPQSTASMVMSSA
jgi:hypothetical protein